jgi:hypothetical protein
MNKLHTSSIYHLATGYQQNSHICQLSKSFDLHLDRSRPCKFDICHSTKGFSWYRMCQRCMFYSLDFHQKVELGKCSHHKSHIYLRRSIFEPSGHTGQFSNFFHLCLDRCEMHTSRIFHLAIGYQQNNHICQLSKSFDLHLDKSRSNMFDIFHSLKGFSWDRMCRRYIFCSQDILQKVELGKCSYHRFHIYLRHSIFQPSGHTSQISSSFHRWLDRCEMHKPHTFL